MGGWAVGRWRQPTWAGGQVVVVAGLVEAASSWTRPHAAATRIQPPSIVTTPPSSPNARASSQNLLPPFRLFPLDASTSNLYFNHSILHQRLTPHRPPPSPPPHLRLCQLLLRAEEQPNQLHLVQVLQGGGAGGAGGEGERRQVGKRGWSESKRVSECVRE